MGILKLSTTKKDSESKLLFLDTSSSTEYEVRQNDDGKLTHVVITGLDGHYRHYTEENAESLGSWIFANCHLPTDITPFP